MKKRLLLLSLMVASSVSGVFAAVGDYVYAPTAKFKVTGANILVNGNFKSNDQGWTNSEGQTISSDAWGLETEDLNLPEGVEGYAIKSKAAKTDTLSTLSYVMQLPAGKYVFTYWVKAESVLTTSIVANGNNYVDFSVNDSGNPLVARGVDGATDQFIATVSSFTTDWKQIVYPIEIDNDGYFVFNARNVASGTLFADFQITPAIEVYDTRIADNLLKYLKGILAEDGFDQGEARGALEEIAGALEETLTLPEYAEDRESPDAMAELMGETDELIKNYLDASAGNLVGSTDNNGNSITRYLEDWGRHAYTNWNNMSTYGKWNFDGGRWGFSPNDESLERPANDGWVASAGIQTSYTLDVGININASAFTNTSIVPGRYMFSVEAQAVASLNKAAPYGANEGIEIKGPSIWVGNDTTVMKDVVLNNNNWQKLYIVSEISEGESLTAGFHFPVVEGSQGGRYSLRNPEFRMVGKTQEEVDHLYGYDQLIVQKNALKERLDLAAADLQKNKEDGFPWGHAVLKDSIDKYAAVYNDLLTVVDADGNELQPDLVTLEYKDQILAAVQAMNSARNAYASTNRAFQTLKADITVCNASLNDEANAAGNKTAFQNVIGEAQGMVDNTTLDADEVESFVAEDEKLLLAKEEFEKGTASREHPANIYLAGKNLNFESWSSKSTYNSDRTVNGWEFTIGEEGKQWDVQPSDMFELGGRASIWRGTTVGPNGRIRQTVTLTTPGVYEFRSGAFSAEYGDGSRWSEYMNIATICGSVLDWDTFENAPVDTIYKPNVRLFFGPVGATNDSITLTKCAPEDYLRTPKGLVYTREYPMNYSVIYVKKNAEAETVEFGLEAFENLASAGACTFGLGNNRLYYLGSEEAYNNATDAAYNTEVNKAKGLITKYGVDHEQVGWIIYKLMRYVGDSDYPWVDGVSYVAPTTIQEKQNVILSLQEYEEMLDKALDPTLGIQELEADASSNGVAVGGAAGAYTLSGVKVSGNLKPGLYIVNGKKYLIK